MTPRIHSSAADELSALQIAQFKHDEVYHREIARLTVHARLNHMALHFCKYVGQLATALPYEDRLTIRRTVIDSFVIALSSANTLNLKLDDAIPETKMAPSLAELGELLIRKDATHTDRYSNWLLVAFAKEAGEIARACEKLDHLEAFPFRETIASSVIGICRTSLVAATLYGFDIVKSIRERFDEIEPKYLFHKIP
jgi:hypothetical protein